MDIPTFEELFKQTKINFNLLGIPFNSCKIQPRFFLLLFSLVIIVFEEFLFLISKISFENFLGLTQLAPCFFVGTLSILKFSCIAYKRHIIFHLSENLQSLYGDMIHRYKDIVKSEFKILHSFMKYYFILNVVLVSIYNFATLPLIAYKYFQTQTIVFSLPYSVIVPFPTETWFTWFIVYAHSVFSGYICILYFTTADALYFILSCHVCANFKIIKHDVQNLNSSNICTIDIIIKKHQNIFKLSNDLDEIFTAANLFNILVGSIQICALGFNLTYGNWSQIPGCLLFLVSVLLQILMTSFFGENIMTESQNVSEAAYLIKWYDIEEKFKKSILILMTRAQKPQRLTAYKFSNICYGSFTKIISTSWSYFTILQVMYDDSVDTEDNGAQNI